MNVAAHTSQARPLSLRPSQPSREGRRMFRELEVALGRAFVFTRREREVVRRLVAGTSTETIARELQIRVTSVHKHMHRIFAKTRTEGRQPLIGLAFRLAARRRIFAGPQPTDRLALA